MENIKNNYKALLTEYETASQLFQDKGLTRLLAHTLENLERFERLFLELYTVEELLEIQTNGGK